MALRLSSLVWAGLRLGASASVLALAATSAYAQEVTGTIRGDVQDENGAPLAGATVTVTHVPSGTRSVQTTDGSGSFSAPNLRVGGPFDVSVSAAGFEGAQATVPQIQAGVPQRIAVVLVSEGATIEVTAARAISSIAIATGPSTSLNAREIAGIASVNRDIRNLAARDPFVNLDPTNGGAISIAGQNNRFNRITVDGIAFGDPFGLESGGLASSRGAVPLDAIAEFTVETAPVDIQQGNFQGGAINTVLKSGGNDFDIGGFFTYSSDALAGSKTRGITVDREFESKIYGAQVTGPIIKDKLFFAVTWERLRDTTPSLTGPIDEGFANQLPITRAQIDRIKSIADTVYNYDTLDVASGVPEEDDKLVVKLDWNISDQHRASATYIYNKGNLLAGLTGANQVTATNPTLALQSNNYDQGAINHYGVFQLNSEWSDSFSTQARVSYHDYKRLQVPFNGREFGQFQVCQAEVDIPATPPLNSNLLCPAGTGRIQFGPDISRQANELFVKTLGIELQARIQGNGHDVKFIAERRGQDINNLFAQRVSGAWYFDTIPNFQNRQAAELDYGSPIRGDIDTTRALFENNVYTFGVQDTWEVSDALTFIYGARYDLYQTNDRPLFNQNFVNRSGFTNNSTLNGRDLLQPRFGLNYRASDRLRLSASAGLFGGGSPNVWISNSYSNPGPLLGRVQVRRTATGFTIDGVTGLSAADANTIGAATLNNVSGGTGIPDVLDQLIATSGSAVAPTNVLDPNFEVPSQWRISGTAEYAANLGPLGDDWRFSGSVIWSRVKNALTWTDLRSVPNTVQARLPDGRLRYQAFNTASGTNTDIFLTNTNKGYSWNIAAAVDKRFENGFSLGAAYTWQRVKDVNPGTSSVAFSNYDNTVTALDPNGSAYGTSNYQIDNAWRLRAGYDSTIFGDNVTRFELFYNSRAGQRYSHTFADIGTSGRSAIFGMTGNDGRQLMYVPIVASISADPLVSYDSPATFAALQEFIQNGSLDGYQGKIAPKNLGKSPRFNKLDLRISQEVPFVFGGKIELFGDIENVLNLINDDWGSLRQVAFPYRATVVNVQCLQASGAPVTGLTQNCASYRYSGFRAPAETIFTNISIWQVRLGVRLQFRGL
jgi:outer membrane receptor protein involved in Fe transport